jgi:hypothetical protein
MDFYSVDDMLLLRKPSCDTNNTNNTIIIILAILNRTDGQKPVFWASPILLKLPQPVSLKANFNIFQFAPVPLTSFHLVMLNNSVLWEFVLIATSTLVTSIVTHSCNLCCVGNARVRSVCIFELDVAVSNRKDVWLLHNTAFMAHVCRQQQ